ncbi:DNA-(apurinic or apyrimidinic site) lyase APN2 KNAG_0G01460 [Huiozyma naganishii CBS 8797]|uniref:DNA-(apurinic or apyrimidinic site) endonuclease 2 n=1 Tax=Huiozyma naganishii (strain ATCC MYA-139 / BCRC 22969 / CBS 8797 / KCTC 17520 / NBRC 10181 / NCYC 3082 / Yp74L-3) TaxID=1071383 RepID=J7S7V8_HUIN7|nr:hypothetical protein KNAG_0G01460 [Kazachstania naganishii CBS 8797]CCK71204.1 hypothetical protein KNAG_0G01460 [Kazachstania naganishii CBS 8797]
MHIPPKDVVDGDCVRILTFNVNGVRTLFHYKPFHDWTPSLTKTFNYFNADIITFQELKVSRENIDAKLGCIDGFHSFISIPSTKKSYSGVGVWVRKYPSGHPLSPFLTVLKAEEGISGYLPIKLTKNCTVRYRDDPSIGIGGYVDTLEEADALKLDSEGRCVMIELACNTVVISVYCPANSTGTDEGELFRCHFLRMLFQRVKNLETMGKRVVLMGDLNVCRDLIDSADAIQELGLGSYKGGCELEDKCAVQAQNFIMDHSKPHRRFLNQLLCDSIIPELAQGGLLLDSTRFIQKRDRLKMYTVWNTQKNTRPMNFGSRIDFILVSNKLQQSIRDSNILPDVQGSDHCPVYTDLRLDSALTGVTMSPKIPRFEAKYKYNLLNHNVMSMFTKGKSKTLTPISPTSQAESRATATAIDVKKRPASRTSSIDSFFKSSKQPKLVTPSNEPIFMTPSQECTITVPKTLKKATVPFFKNAFGDPPLCDHGEEATLKTSKTSSNPGKKFWICRRSRGDDRNKEASCKFFQWA